MRRLGIFQFPVGWSFRRAVDCPQEDRSADSSGSVPNPCGTGAGYVSYEWYEENCRTRSISNSCLPENPDLPLAGYDFRAARSCRSLKGPLTGMSGYVRRPAFWRYSRIRRPLAPAAHRLPLPFHAEPASAGFRGCRQAARRRRALRRSSRPMRRMFRATTERATRRAKPVAPCARTRSSPRCSKLLIADSTAGC